MLDDGLGGAELEHDQRPAPDTERDRLLALEHHVEANHVPPDGKGAIPVGDGEPDRTKSGGEGKPGRRTNVGLGLNCDHAASGTRRPLCDAYNVWSPIANGKG